MPVNFTYGLSFHFVGCSAEIKQKSKSTQKGFQLEAVDPSVVFRCQCWSRTPITKGSSSPCGGEQGLQAPLVTRQQNSRAGTFPAVGALPAPGWWTLLEWLIPLMVRAVSPGTLISPFHSIFQLLLKWLRAAECLWHAHGPGSWRKGETYDLKYIYEFWVKIWQLTMKFYSSR